MKNQTNVMFLSVLLITGLIFTGCKKEELNAVTGDDALFESMDQDVSNISDEAAEGDLSSFKTGASEQDYEILSGCATITRDSVSSPKKITIDFGTVNCMGSDGRNRRGKIIITYTGKYRDAGTVITNTLENYFVNDHQVTGTRIMTNNGRNGSNNLSYTVVSDGTVVLANGEGTITRESTKTREWTAGEGTAIWSDDQYSITGSATGVSAEGIDYSATITSPLLRKIGCKHFVRGIVEIEPGGKKKRVVDFGDGTCDDKATVTVKNKTKTITLR